MAALARGPPAPHTPALISSRVLLRPLGRWRRAGAGLGSLDSPERGGGRGGVSPLRDFIGNSDLGWVPLNTRLPENKARLPGLNKSLGSPQTVILLHPRSPEALCPGHPCLFMVLRQIPSAGGCLDSNLSSPLVNSDFRELCLTL